MSSRLSGGWTLNCCIITIMLAIWLAATVVPVYYFDWFEGSGASGGLAYWIAAYAAPLTYLFLLALYTWLMRSGRRRP